VAIGWRDKSSDYIERGLNPAKVIRVGDRILMGISGRYIEILELPTASNL
jgi:20S proteasome alpha/beta subunit